MPRTFDHSDIVIPCKILFGIPFIFSFCSQILWTLISLYRLFLVIRSVHGEPPPTRHLRSRLTILIPVSAFLLSVLSACLTSYISEPFLLYRVCTGSANTTDTKEWVAVYYSMIPAIILYLPAGISYAVIFIVVHRASTRQKNYHGVENCIRITADPASVMESCNEDDPSLTLHKKTILNQFSKSLKETSSSLNENIDINTGHSYQTKKRLSISLPARINLLSQGKSMERLASNRPGRKLIRRNIISAKLSVMVMLILFTAGVLMSMTYNQVKTIQVRSLSKYQNKICKRIDCWL